MTITPSLSILAALAITIPTAAQEEKSSARTDYSDLATPTCELEALTAYPPDGWVNVPIQNPPAGHFGCQMMFTNADGSMVGIIRVRAVASPAVEFTEEGFDSFIRRELGVINQMGFTLVEDPLWIREEVPVRGEGFFGGRAGGYAATYRGNDVPQEVHILLFGGSEAKYLLVLLTAAKSAGDGVYERNVADFGKLITTLQPGRK